jgi:tetratricopeptide (TPR) repeat protein
VGAGEAHAPVARGARDPAVVEAERLLRDLRGADAERALERAGGVDPRAMERSWVLLDLRRSRCADRLAREEAARVHRAGDVASEVLFARVTGTPAERLRVARRAFGSSIEGWARLEAALALEEEGAHAETARDHARRAAAAGPAYVRREALVALGRLALDDGAPSDALETAARGRALDAEDPRFPTLSAIASARLGRDDDAARFAADALLAQPKSRRAARRLADALREGPGASVERAVTERLAPLFETTTSGEALAVAATLAEAQGDREAAISLYERALAADASPVPVDRRLRRLLFAAGRVREGLSLLRRAVPPECSTDPGNLRRPAWEALAGAEERLARSPKDPRATEAVAEALVGVGAVEEALSCLRRVEGGTPEGVALAARLSGHLAFEKALRAEVEEGYRRKACDGPEGALYPLLHRVRELARRHLPAEEAAAFERPDVGLRRVPFLGGWLDTAATTASPVVAHFRRYGRFLVLGQRAGQPPEAMLFSLASLSEKREVRTQGHVFRHDVAVGYDRELRSYVDFRGGALCGACLPDGVWLDADSSRREEHALRASVDLPDDVLARLDAASADPPPADGIDGPFALDRPEEVSLRLVRRYVARGGDGWGSFRALAAHEFGHVLDIDRHLPVLRGLPESAKVLLSQGVSLGNVEAFLEGRAQRAAVIDGPDPDLALAEMTRALPLRERDPGPHERGYADQVAAFVRHVHRFAARYPAIDPHRSIVAQLDRLSNEEIRGIAKAVAGVR